MNGALSEVLGSALAPRSRVAFGGRARRADDRLRRRADGDRGIPDLSGRGAAGGAVADGGDRRGPLLRPGPPDRALPGAARVARRGARRARRACGYGSTSASSRWRPRSSTATAAAICSPAWWPTSTHCRTCISAASSPRSSHWWPALWRWGPRRRSSPPPARCSPAGCWWQVLPCRFSAAGWRCGRARRQAAARGRLSSELVELIDAAPGDRRVSRGARRARARAGSRPRVGGVGAAGRALGRRHRRPRAAGDGRHGVRGAGRGDRGIGGRRARPRADRRARPVGDGLVRGHHPAGHERARAVGDARRRPANPRAHRSGSPSCATRSARCRPPAGRSWWRSSTCAHATRGSPRRPSTASACGSSQGNGLRWSDPAAPERPLWPTCSCAFSTPRSGA